MKIEKIYLIGESNDRIAVVFLKGGVQLRGKIRFPNKGEEVANDYYSQQLKKFKQDNNEQN